MACKLREAEANLSMKELRQKVTDVERHWEVCGATMVVTCNSASGIHLNIWIHHSITNYVPLDSSGFHHFKRYCYHT